MRQFTILAAYVQCVHDYVSAHTGLLEVNSKIEGNMGTVYVQHTLSNVPYKVFTVVAADYNRVDVRFLDHNFRNALDNIEDYLPVKPLSFPPSRANNVVTNLNERNVAMHKKVRQLKTLMEMQEEIEKELKEDFGMLPKDALKWYDELGGENNV